MRIPFDQYQRYENMKRVVNQLRGDNGSFKILEVGAEDHSNLEKFFPNDDIFISNLQTPESQLENPKYIQADATNMAFADNEFDIIIACDVYEHIPQNLRKDFLSELTRVCKIAFIICAPIELPEIHAVEVRTNELYKTLTGHDYIWLKEHIDNGLPCLNETLEILDNLKISHKHFYHGDLNLWEKLMSAHFFAAITPPIQQDLTLIDECYNLNLFEQDYVEENFYRAFVIGEKNCNFNADDFAPKSAQLCTKKLDLLLEKFYKLYHENQLTKSRELILKWTTAPGFAAELFYDIGEGYNVEDLLTFEFSANANGEFNYKHIFDISEIGDIKAIRFDPCTDICIINKAKIIAICDDGEIDLPYTQNGLMNGESNVFLTEDPQLILDLTKAKSKIKFIKVKLKGTVWPFIEKDLLNNFYEAYCRMNHEKGEINARVAQVEQKSAELKQEVARLEQKADGLQQKLDRTLNSTSWKVTKPLRALKPKSRR